MIYFKFGTSNKCTILQCIQEVAVCLQKVLELMSMSVCTGLNPFNFIPKHFLQICIQKVAVYNIFLLRQLAQWFVQTPQQMSTVP
jgi:hypothetical protein